MKYAIILVVTSLIRVAAAARWPGGGVNGGRVVDAALNYTDVMPTLMEVAGVSDGETNDLSKARPEVARRLVQRAREFRELQPRKHVPLLRTGRNGFNAPKHWALPTE